MELVVSLKQNQRDLYQPAIRLFASRPADCSGADQLGGKRYQFQLWDSEGLPFSADYPQPVRVVRSEEKLTQNHYRRGENLTEYACYAVFMILRTARSSRLLTASRLALSSR